MSCVHHLDRCVEIMRKERDPRRWGPLIEKLPDEVRESCRRFLVAEAKRQRVRCQRWMGLHDD